MEKTSLVVLSPLKGVPRPNRKIVLTRKFVEGMSLYKDLWRGPITLACEPTDKLSDNLDNVEVDLDLVPFQTSCDEFHVERLERIIPPNALVLASVGQQFNAISGLCRRLNVPCVYVTEYTLRTRLQIIREYRPTPLHGWWRSAHEISQEVAQVKAISLANGVQCNGTPTYTAYKALTPFPHLFFDTRIEEAMLATSENISARYVGLGSDHPLHLVFSGRLTLMKGVDHLCLVAAHLRKLGVRFEMSICGDGDWAAQLRKDVDKMDLGDLVRLRGTLDFKTELIPFVTKEAHLFVCCHRQGDPSCTYLETMACGVPIVGYANEALRGLVEASGVGWITAINRPIELAEKIASLYRTPSALLASAHRSQAFAREHTFEKTFRRRVEHLDRVAASALSIRS